MTIDHQMCRRLDPEAAFHYYNIYHNIAKCRDVRGCNCDVNQYFIA